MSNFGIRKLLTEGTLTCNNKINQNKRRKEGKIIYKKINSVQKWLPFEEILEEGIIKINNSCYVKIIKVFPINYNLKSDLEKEAILNSYKIFLKTCNFDMQIIVQTNKVDLSNYLSKIKKNNQNENLEIQNYSENYINYLNELNIKKNHSNKNFYILIKNSPITVKEDTKILISDFNEKFFKIKECLSRCGNYTVNVTEKDEIINILNTFLNQGR